MRRPVTILIIAAIGFVAACSNESGPYLKVTGGGFIFNYRLANAMAGILVVARRKLPEDATIEVAFENPAGGPPLIQAAEIGSETQFDLRFESLTGIRQDVDYVATVRLVAADGTELEKVETIYRSLIDQATIMPGKPLTVGPGYTPNPEGAD
jgi:hypothetical protein